MNFDYFNNLNSNSCIKKAHNPFAKFMRNIMLGLLLLVIALFGSVYMPTLFNQNKITNNQPVQAANNITFYNNGGEGADLYTHTTYDCSGMATVAYFGRTYAINSVTIDFYRGGYDLSSFSYTLEGSVIKTTNLYYGTSKTTTTRWSPGTYTSSSSRFYVRRKSDNVGWTNGKTFTINSISWKAKSYTITIIKNNGEANGSNSYTVNSSKAQVIGVPILSRGGYEENGYSITANTSGSDSYFSSAHVLYIPAGAYGNIIVSAVWSPYTYKVYYDTDGGSSISAGSYTVNGQKNQSIKLTTPTKTGYTFSYYYITTNTSRYNSSVDTGILNIPADAYGDITVKAVWSANSYTVTFNANGGSVSPSSKSVTYDSTYGDLPTPTKTGYTFNGWQYNYSLVTSVSKTQASGDWSGGWYTGISLTQYGLVSGQTYTATFDMKISSGSLGWQSGTFFVNSNSTSTLYSKDKSTQDNLTTNWQTYTATFTYTTDTGNYSASPVHIYPVMNTGITYYIQNFSVVANNNTFITSSTKVTTASNHMLVAKWSVNSYTATFNANGGSVSPSSKSVTYDSTYGTLPTPTRTGYQFAGWYTSNSVTNLFDPSNFVQDMLRQRPSGNYTSFDSSTGKLSVAGSWTYNSSAGDYYYYKPSCLVVGRTYTLSYKAQSASATSDTPVIGLGINYNGSNSTAITVYDANVNNFLTTFTIGEGWKGFYVGFYYGYEIKCWDICLVESSNVGTSSYPNLVESFETVKTASNHTLYANWTPNSYNVALNPNGGTLVGNKIRFIRDFANGSTANASSHWAEIMAFNTAGINVALKTNGATSLLYNGSATRVISTDALLDGNTEASQWQLSGMDSGPLLSYQTVDLGSIQEIEKIIVWHYWADGRTYHKTRTQVSADGEHWVDVFNSEESGEYPENSAGHTIYLSPKIVKTDQAVGSLETPIKEGYYFDGWYSDNGTFENRILASTILNTKFPGGMLYAKWVKNVNGYTFLDYIESHGVEYINTGWKATSEVVKYQLVWKETTLNSEISLFGAYEGGIHAGTLYHPSNGNLTVYIGTTSMFYQSFAANRINYLSANINNGSIANSINGVSASGTYSGTIKINNPMCVFATSVDGGAIELASYRLYRFKIYENNGLVRDYIPALNSNGVAGLYDLVNNNFATNSSGTGIFGVGYDEGNETLKLANPEGQTYYNLNGASAINLGRVYMYTDKFTFSCDAYMDDWANFTSGSQRLVSCTEGGGFNIENNGDYIQAALNIGGTYTNATSTVTWASLAPGWHNFLVSYDGTNGRLYLDGVPIAINSDTSSSIQYHSTNVIWVGGEASDSNNTPASRFNGKIGNIKFYHDAVSPNANTVNFSMNDETTNTNLFDFYKFANSVKLYGTSNGTTTINYAEQSFTLTGTGGDLYTHTYENSNSAQINNLYYIPNSGSNSYTLSWTQDSLNASVRNFIFGGTTAMNYSDLAESEKLLNSVEGGYRYSLTLTTSQPFVKIRLGSVYNGSIKIWDIKLEKASKATPYSPAAKTVIQGTDGYDSVNLFSWSRVLSVINGTIDKSANTLTAPTVTDNTFGGFWPDTYYDGSYHSGLSQVSTGTATDIVYILKKTGDLREMRFKFNGNKADSLFIYDITYLESGTYRVSIKIDRPVPTTSGVAYDFRIVKVSDNPYNSHMSPLESATKEGYNFSGWSEQKYTNNYIDGNSLADSTIYYAQWENKVYKVNFDAGDGKVTPPSKKVTYSSFYGSLPTAKKTGYVSNGWKINYASAANWQDNTTINGDNGATESNTSYYTHVNLIPFKTGSSSVTITLNYAICGVYAYTEDMSPNTAASAGAAAGRCSSFSTTAVIPANTCYIRFEVAKNGLSYENRNLLIATTDSYISENSLLTIPHDINLVTDYTATTYQIMFDANGGSGSMSNLDCVYDTVYQLPANTFTKQGYAFVGWKVTDNLGSEANYGSTSTNVLNSILLNTLIQDAYYIKNLTDNGGVVKLTAQWNTASYLNNANFVSLLESVITSSGWTVSFVNEAPNGVTFNDYTKYLGSTTLGGTPVKGAITYGISGKTLYIYSANTIFAPQDSSYMFGKNGNNYSPNIISINFANFNTSETTDMQGMFVGCSNLTSLDVSTFNTNKVTNMYAMFADCSSLTSLNLSNFNTELVTDMFMMFFNCANLKSLDISSFTILSTCAVEGYFDETSIDEIKTPYKLPSGIYLALNNEDYYIYNSTKASDINKGPLNAVYYTNERYNTQFVTLKRAYTITFNNNGGTGTMANQLAYPNIYGNSVEVLLHPNTFTKTGYNFIGWSNTENGSVDYINDQAISLSSSKTLYAVWEKTTANVAKINDIYFKSLKEAVDYANKLSGSFTITILTTTNEKETITINSGVNITLTSNTLVRVEFSNGKNLINNGTLQQTSNNIRFISDNNTIINKGTLTLDNFEVCGGDNVVASGVLADIINEGTINLKGTIKLTNGIYSSTATPLNVTGALNSNISLKLNPSNYNTVGQSVVVFNSGTKVENYYTKFNITAPENYATAVDKTNNKIKLIKAGSRGNELHSDGAITINVATSSNLSSTTYYGTITLSYYDKDAGVIKTMSYGLKNGTLTLTKLLYSNYTITIRTNYKVKSDVKIVCLEISNSTAKILNVNLS